MSALNLAFAVALVLVVLVLASRLRSLREQPPPRPFWQVMALTIGLVLVFQLLSVVFD